MRMLLFIAGGIVAAIVLLVVVMLVIGSRLEPRHVASRSIHLNRSPDEVYGLIHNFKISPEWRPDVKKVEMLGTVDGHPRFREEGSNGTVTYEVLDDVPDQRLVTRIVDKGLGYSGSWTYVLTRAEGGTRLTITENGEVTNPLFRFMSKYIFGHTATMDTYFENLGARFGQLVKPEDAK